MSVTVCICLQPDNSDFFKRHGPVSPGELMNWDTMGRRSRGGGGCLSSSEDEAQIWGWSPGLGSLFVCSFIPYCWKINISLPSSLNLPLIIIFKSYSPSSNHMIQNRNLQQILPALPMRLIDGVITWPMFYHVAVWAVTSSFNFFYKWDLLTRVSAWSDFQIPRSDMFHIFSHWIVFAQMQSISELNIQF